MTLPPPPDRWTIELANTERAEAIAAFGFTDFVLARGVLAMRSLTR